ncbi:MAG: hypothetical protein AMXMBFR25_12490 [Lysobacterales bacterium]
MPIGGMRGVPCADFDARNGMRTAAGGCDWAAAMTSNGPFGPDDAEMIVVSLAALRGFSMPAGIRPTVTVIDSGNAPCPGCCD